LATCSGSDTWGLAAKLMSTMIIRRQPTGSPCRKCRMLWERDRFVTIGTQDLGNRRRRHLPVSKRSSGKYFSIASFQKDYRTHISIEFGNQLHAGGPLRGHEPKRRARPAGSPGSNVAGCRRRHLSINARAIQRQVHQSADGLSLGNLRFLAVSPSPSAPKLLFREQPALVLSAALDQPGRPIGRSVFVDLAFFWHCASQLFSIFLQKFFD
jgi:hypothetical protein